MRVKNYIKSESFININNKLNFIKLQTIYILLNYALNTFLREVILLNFKYLYAWSHKGLLNLIKRIWL